MRQILLLHGAIGSKDQFSLLSLKLADKFVVHTLDFRGHGSSEKETDMFSIPAFADDVLEYLSENKIDMIDIFGYSMGGYVALYLAKNHPERVGKVFTLATKFDWTPEIALREAKMLNPEKIAEKIPAFARQLENRHKKHDWKKVLYSTAEMMIGLGTANSVANGDLILIPHHVLIGVGDSDMMVTLEETIGAYRALPFANLIVFPEMQHPIEKVDSEKLSDVITSFFGYLTNF